jgi:hypothetical protein
VVVGIDQFEKPWYEMGIRDITLSLIKHNDLASPSLVIVSYTQMHFGNDCVKNSRSGEYSPIDR